MPVLTRSDLLRFAPGADPSVVTAIVGYADAAFHKWGINTAARLWMFLAQTKVESAGYTKLFEDMDYSAGRLVQVWPSRFPSVAAAIPYARNPQKLANYTYGGRMGNTGLNDGWLCRGTGLLQTTGLTSFSTLAKVLGVSVDQCRAMLTADDTMLVCAAAVFRAWGCLPLADEADVAGCTRKLNGGRIGLDDRRAAYALAKKIWPSFKLS